MKNFLYVVGGIVGVALIGAFIFWIGWVNNIERHEFAYSYNKFNGGKIEKFPNRHGIFITPPWVSVYGIDTRPTQVQILVGGTASSDNNSGAPTGVNNRMLNANMVQFNPDGLDDLIRRHGILHGNISQILMIYAFDQEGKSYPFLIVDGKTVSGGTPSQEVSKWAHQKRIL